MIPDKEKILARSNRTLTQLEFKLAELPNIAFENTDIILAIQAETRKLPMLLAYSCAVLLDEVLSEKRG